MASDVINSLCVEAGGSPCLFSMTGRGFTARYWGKVFEEKKQLTFFEGFSHGLYNYSIY